MEPTRVDPKKLILAINEATQKVDEAAAILAPYLAIISLDERVVTPRPRDGFDAAARSLTRAMKDHPNVVAASDFDAEAVVEDLDNVIALKPLAEKVAELGLRLADTRLTWTAEAYLPSLVAYNVAKALSSTNAALRTVIGPLANMFAARRARRKADKPAAPAAPAAPAKPVKAEEEA